MFQRSGVALVGIIGNLAIFCRQQKESGKQTMALPER
jgi:RNA-binding protein YhbY